MNKLLVATKNKNKLREISQILSELNIEVISAYDVINTDIEIEETGQTFEENAKLKSEAISLLTDEYVIADDSGLEVDYLNGAPGVYSARFAGENTDDEMNNNKLLKKLENIPTENRTARFVSVISLSKNGKTIKTFKGTCEGIIAEKKSGDNGFGYDPIFLLDTGKTMAEISPDEKNSISHRNKALKKLKEFIEQNI
jgi:XTP/dITP diphosphohydrolase